jgi:hypothetical protein
MSVVEELTTANARYSAGFSKRGIRFPQVS